MYDRPYLNDRPELDNMTRREQILNDDYFTYRKVPMTKIFKKFFRRIDFYAKPITLRHKGEYKFYTNLGAYTSLFIILIMIGFTTVLAINMINGNEFTVQHRIISYNNEFPVVPLGKNSFSMGFALFDEDGNLFDDLSYFKFNMFVKTYNK